MHLNNNKDESGTVASGTKINRLQLISQPGPSYSCHLIFKVCQKGETLRTNELLILLLSSGMISELLCVLTLFF